MYPIARPYIPIGALVSLCQFWKYTQKTIDIFEQQFAARIGRRYGIAYSSARVAIQELLETMNVKEKSIALPAYTCIVVPYAIELSGNTPLFIESPSKDVLVPSPAALLAASDIIIQTHMFGIMQDIPQKKDTQFIIEDSCLAVGSSHNGKKAGTVGDVSVFSFNRSKQLGGIGGGMLLTDDQSLFHALDKRRSYTADWKDELIAIGKAIIFAFYYKKPLYSLAKYILPPSLFPPTDFRVDTIALAPVYKKRFLYAQAILELYHLKKYDWILEKRREIAAWYDAELRSFKDIVIPQIDSEIQLSHYFIILSKNRETVRKKLLERGIQTGVANEYSCPTTPWYRDKHSAQDFMMSTNVGDSIINLPFYIGLTKKDVQYICEVFRDVYESA